MIYRCIPLILCVFVFIISSMFVPVVHAQAIGSTSNCVPGTFCALAPIPGLTDTGTTGSVLNGQIATFLNKVYDYCIGVAVVLAVLMIIWGGIEIMFQRGNISSQSAGRQKIQNAILGLILVLAPYVVFSVLNPSILNLNVNMPALQTKWGNYTPPAPGATPAPIPGGGTGLITPNGVTACNGSDCSVPTADCNKIGGAPQKVCVDHTSNSAYSPGVGGAPGTSTACGTGDVWAIQCNVWSGNGVI